MKGKWLASLMLVAMFGLGMASGVLLQMYRTNEPAEELSPAAARRIKSLKHELHLTPEQEISLRDILRNANQRATEINQEVSWDLADIHQESMDALRKILTPEQNKALQQLHRRIHARHYLPAPALSPDDEGNSATS